MHKRNPKEDFLMWVQEATEEGSSLRSFLWSGKQFSDEELEEIVLNGDVKMRLSLAQKEVPQTLLDKLTKDESLLVRVAAIGNAYNSSGIFRTAVLKGNYSQRVKRSFAHSSHALEDVEVFEHLWYHTEKASEILVKSIEQALYAKPHLKDGSMIFSMSQEVWINPPVIDKRIYDFMKAEVLTAPDRTRVAYCNIMAGDPHVLDMMKDDTNMEVIEAIAENPIASDSTHQYLVEKYPTRNVLRNICYSTNNSDLLAALYKGTKSEAVRFEVLGNHYYKSHQKCDDDCTFEKQHRGWF